MPTKARKKPTALEAIPLWPHEEAPESCREEKYSGVSQYTAEQWVKELNMRVYELEKERWLFTPDAPPPAPYAMPVLEINKPEDLPSAKLSPYKYLTLSFNLMMPDEALTAEMVRRIHKHRKLLKISPPVTRAGHQAENTLNASFGTIQFARWQNNQILRLLDLEIFSRKNNVRFRPTLVCKWLFGKDAHPSRVNKAWVVAKKAMADLVKLNTQTVVAAAVAVKKKPNSALIKPTIKAKVE